MCGTQHRGGHRRIEEREAPLARRLRLIHGQVGLADQLVHPRGQPGVGHADAEVDPDQLVAGVHGREPGLAAREHDLARDAAQALEVVLGNAPEMDVLVAISHEGGTRLTLEAIRAFAGETWVVTGAADSAIAKEVDHVVVATPAIEESYCHTVSYTCAVAAGRALQGEDVAGLAADVFRELDSEPLAASEHDRFVLAGAGRDTATVLEGVLKLREGAHVPAEAHHTEQLLHGHLAAVDPGVRCFVLEGEGRAAERAVDAMRALGELGCEALLVPTTHPVVDIVRFQRLTCDLADARGVDPDMIRWDEDPWDRARRAQNWTAPTDQ